MKIEIRKTCKICDNPITMNMARTYCSASCRNKFHNAKHRPEHSEWQRKRNDERAKVKSDKKVQCLVCKGWYVQVCSHAYARHQMTAREYREYFDLEMKKGVVPKWYSEMKGEQAMENGTVSNLEKGAKFRYVKGDKKAGRYHRSQITLDRLKVLYKYRKYGDKNNRSSSVSE